MLGGNDLGTLAVTMAVNNGPLERGFKRSVMVVERAGLRMETSLKRVGQRVTNVGKTLSLRLSAPLAAVSGGVIRVGATFESEMNKVQANSQATGVQLVKLTKIAKDIGGDRGIPGNAIDAARAMDVLAKNGIRVADLLDKRTTRSVIVLAKATGGDFARAADIATDAQVQFNQSVADLPKIADTITGFTVKSKFNLNDFALATGQAGKVAADSGVEFQDFVVSIAGTASAFSSGSDAGTSYKTFLGSLNPKSKEARFQMEKLGLSFFRANGELKDGAEIAGELSKAVQGLTEQQRSLAFTTIFGRDAIRTANGLASLGAEGFRRLSEEIAGVSASDNLSKRLRGFDGGVVKLRKSFTALNIAIADSGLLASATRKVEGLAVGVSKLAKIDPEILKIAGTILLVGSVLGPVTIGLGIFIASLGQVLGVALAVGSGLAGFASTSGLAKLAIAGLAASAVVFRQEFTNAFERARDALRAGGLQAGLRSIRESLASGLVSLREWVGGLAIGSITVEDITRKLGSFGTTALKVVAAFGGLAAISLILTRIQKTLAPVVSGFRKFIELLPGITAIRSSIGGIAGRLSTLLVANPIIAAIVGSIVLFRNELGVTGKEVIEFGGELVESFRTSFQLAEGIFSNAISDFRAGFVAIATGVGIAGDAIGDLFGGVDDKSKTAADTIALSFTGVVAVVVAAAGKIAKVAGSVIGKAFEGAAFAVDIITLAVDKFSTEGPRLIDRVTRSIDKLTKAINRALDAAKGIQDIPGKFFSDRAIIDGAKNLLGFGPDDVERGAVEIRGAISRLDLKAPKVDSRPLSDSLRQMSDRLRSEAEKIKSGFASPISSENTKLDASFASLEDNVTGNSYIPDMVTKAIAEGRRLISDFFNPLNAHVRALDAQFSGLENRFDASKFAIQTPSVSDFQQVNAATGFSGFEDVSLTVDIDPIDTTELNLLTNSLPEIKPEVNLDNISLNVSQISDELPSAAEIDVRPVIDNSLFPDAEEEATAFADRVKGRLSEVNESFDSLNDSAAGFGAALDESAKTPLGSISALRQQLSAIERDLERSKIGSEAFKELSSAAAKARREIALAEESSERLVKVAVRVPSVGEAMQEALGDAGGFIGITFDNLSSRLDEFVRTGKANFKDFGKTIIAEIALVQAKAGLKSIANSLSKSFGGQNSGIFSTVLSGIFGSFGGARASGGPITGGRSYLVGEEGPEILSTNRNAHIISNDDITSGGGQNGGLVVQQEIHLQPGVSHEELAAVLPEFQRVTEEGILGRIANGGQPANAFQV